jgi:hypothetical protein
MFDKEPITYRLRNPITGTVRSADRTASWTIEEMTFCFLDDHQEPAFGLIENCADLLLDDAGEPVPNEVLSLLDLEGGVRQAFEREFGAAWDAVENDG